MGYVVALGTLVTVLGLRSKDTWIVLAGIWGVAGQLTISYFIAGFSKMLSPIWRNGEAVSAVMNTFSYGHPAAARIATNYPSFSFVLCWVIMLSESLFPMALLLPLPMLYIALAMFFIVHWVNAFFYESKCFSVGVRFGLPISHPGQYCPSSLAGTKLIEGSAHPPLRRADPGSHACSSPLSSRLAISGRITH